MCRILQGEELDSLIVFSRELHMSRSIPLQDSTTMSGLLLKSKVVDDGTPMSET